MTINTDYKAYHRSIAQELKATQNRIRNLIGSNHWPSDGEHKEAVLRKTLRVHLPESFHVGRGFVCYEDEASSQLDVLITNKNKPFLFKDGELTITTPDCVEAIIEVKTSQESPNALLDTLNRLGNAIEKVRNSDQVCLAGLFMFNEALDDQTILRCLHQAANERTDRIVNFVANGPRSFFRFWENGLHQADGVFDGSVWHSYRFQGHRNHGLAQAYFISNLVMSLSPESYPGARYAWFPLRLEEGGKERFRQFYVRLEDAQVFPFE